MRVILGSIGQVCCPVILISYAALEPILPYRSASRCMEMGLSDDSNDACYPVRVGSSLGVCGAT